VFLGINSLFKEKEVCPEQVDTTHQVLFGKLGVSVLRDPHNF